MRNKLQADSFSQVRNSVGYPSGENV